jgi:exodeoxyribonuclease VII small subunit
MGQKQTATENTNQTFETAIERLERIVEEMEGDKLPLEKLLERYEEGSTLVKVCQEKLETAERRIEIITRGASGKPQVAPFEPATQPAEEKEPPTAAAPMPLTPRKKAAAPADVSLF